MGFRYDARGKPWVNNKWTISMEIWYDITSCMPTANQDRKFLTQKKWSDGWLDFHKIIDMPPHYPYGELGLCLGHDERSQCQYAQREDAWGTPWEPSLDLWVKSDGMVTVMFRTLLSKPLPVEERLKTMFPDSKIEV